MASSTCLCFREMKREREREREEKRLVRLWDLDCGGASHTAKSGQRSCLPPLCTYEKRKARIAALSMKEEATAADAEEGESAERLALLVGEMDKVAAAAGDVLVGAAPAERTTWR